MKKKKILVLADSPLAPSGVGTQTKYMIEGLLKTNEFSFVCLAGAIKHQDYRIQKVEPYIDDWIIHPVDGYGTPDIVRSMIHSYKPDLVWFMTDPRFWVWLWEMEDEIRINIPMVYYHVWDNFPAPEYNSNFYRSNDLICSISKVTHEIIETLTPEVNTVRIPHTVDTNIFKKRTNEELKQMKEDTKSGDKFVFFWNNRNARRKQSGSLIFWFKEFLDRVGHDKACLIMHTEPKDPNGQDLVAIIDHLGLVSGQVLLSTNKLSPQNLSLLYNIADCTINISDAEGFGLATLESLACETPIIVNMTGGLQEQVTDGEEWFGIGIEPSSKAIIGSQDVPYIYEDRISKEDFIAALEEMYTKSRSERDTLGQKGREHVKKEYGMPQYIGLWYDTLKRCIEENGSWQTRVNYNSWEISEI